MQHALCCFEFLCATISQGSTKMKHHSSFPAIQGGAKGVRRVLLLISVGFCSTFSKTT